MSRSPEASTKMALTHSVASRNDRKIAVRCKIGCRHVRSRKSCRLSEGDRQYAVCKLLTGG